IRTINEWIRRGLPWDPKIMDEEDSVTPVTLGALPPGYAPVAAAASSPDTNRLVIARGGRLFLHDLSATNFPVLAQVGAALDVVESLAWSPDGRSIASGSFRRVSIWDAGDLKPRREWTNGFVGRVTALKFSPNGRTLAIGDGESTRSGWVRLIDLDSGKV